MHLDFQIFEGGLRVKSCRGVFNLTYPEQIWGNFSAEERAFFLDNIAYLNTACMPLVSGIKEIRYNTSLPLFKKFFDKSILKDIPSAVEEYKQEETKKIIQQFKAINYTFGNKKTKKPVFDAKTYKRAVVTFSSGKDSLLTLAVCNEIGLNPVPIYINDTVSPTENALKLRFIKKISRENKLDFEIVANNIEKLNDFEFWEKDETNRGYSHMILCFCFLSLPILKFYNAKYLIMGNELDLNSSFVNKDGFVCYPSYDQSLEGTKRLNNLMKKATLDKAEAGSVISPLHDIAIMKVLHKRYTSFGKYQSSCCGLDASKEKRWCSSCTDCVRFFLYMAANSINPKKIGIMHNMFNKKFLKYHALFNPKEKGRYEKSGGDEQLKLAYYLAYRNGAKGYIIDLFKKKFLDEVKGKEDKLDKEYFGIHSTELIPKKIRNDVISVYKEELSRF